MKGFKMNVYKAGIACAAVVSILGISAFCYGSEGDGGNQEVIYIDYEDSVGQADGDKEEQYRNFLKSEVEAVIESTSQISSCHIDLDVSDNVIIKVDMMLEFVESFEGDQEEIMGSIKSAVASMIGLSADDVSVSVQ